MAEKSNNITNNNADDRTQTDNKSQLTDELYLEKLKELRPLDDEFMRALFRNNLPLAQMVLRIILGKNDLVLTEEETQYDLKRLAGGRSLCLDVKGVDDANKQYDIEVQKASAGARPHRARYHSSAIDVDVLKAGQEFEELPDTYTIFITESDVYGANEPIYIIDRVNKTTGKDFDDGEHIIYVNGAYEGDSDIGKLMHDFRCKNADDMNFDLMAERTRYLKEDPKGVREMCAILEEMRNDAVHEDRLRTAKQLILGGKLSYEEIAESTRLTVTEVQNLAEVKTA